MKKLLIGAMLLCSALAGTSATAQVRVNVNIGTPVNNSAWYNTDDNYYYLPEQGVYYNTTRRVYVYQDNNNWVYASRLPQRYNGFTWQRSHYVQVRERSPFMHHEEYANHYNRNYRGGHETWRRGYQNDHDHGNDHSRRNDYGHNNGHR